MKFFNRIQQRKQFGKSDEAPFLVVGLGNPGKKYDNTRHNIGFEAVDLLGEKLGVSIRKSKFQSLSELTQIGGRKVLLLKPQTYMNLSGNAVAEACDFYKIPPSQVIVLFDDVSLPPGKVRIRTKGSHGGHNGIKDIIAQLGTEDFPRVKIGVGEKPNPNYDLADWVLSRFTSGEKADIYKAIDGIEDMVCLIASGQSTEAMNRYNGK